MKKKLNEILEFFNFEKLKKDKRIVAFLVCLLIATVLWFLNALSKDYSTTIAFPVKYVEAPHNQFLANEPPQKLDLKVNAHGFTLLRHKLSLSFSPIVLNLTNITRDAENSEEGFRVNTSSLIRRISNQVSNEITINDIQPEILRIKLDSLKTKMIPVKGNIELSFKPQFNLKEAVILNPKEVKITGPAAVLDTVYILFTKKETFEKIDSEVEKVLEVIYPENTTISPEKVTLTIPVEKFTEKEIKIPVQIRNKPDSTNIKLFPSEIELTVLVGLSDFESVQSSNFDVFVDFEKIDPNSESLKVTVQSNASHLKIIRYEPEIVEFLVETN